MELLIAISVLTLIGGLVAGLLVSLHRKPARQQPGHSKQVSPDESRTLGNLRMLRRIDKMILSNLSFTYVAQEIVDLIPQTKTMLGGTLRVADDTSGQLDVVAVSKPLIDPAKPKNLKQLIGTALTPEQVQRAASRIAQAIDQRQVVTGSELKDFEGPTLDAKAAGEVQTALGIKSVIVYPIIVEDHLSGSLTFYFDRPEAEITEHDHEVMQGIADEVGIAVENSKLLLQLADMNQKLSEANAHLKEVDAMKDDFIAVASHQLRSPLTAIKGYLSMLNEGDFGDVPKPQQSVLKQLGHSTNEVINLINDMLSVSRISAGKFELSKAAVRLEELVKSVFNELSPLASKKSLDLVLELPKQPLGELTVDPLRIRQVVINFIDNAIKYTKQGQVTVTLAKVDHDIVFTVSDTGIGIPKGETDKMFKKFYRASNAQRVETQGSGLGLYVAQEIINRHRGSMILESVEGKGSTFGFRLPLATVSAGQPETRPQVAATS